MAHRYVLKTTTWVVVVCACLVALGCARESGHGQISTVVDIQPSTLLEVPPANNWPSYNGDYTGRRYSSLAQINVSNVRQLRAQWVFHAANSSALEVTPVVYNGIMFVTAANDTFALDARTGRVIWHNRMPITEGLIDDASRHISRGVGLWHSRVYRETDNAHLVCLDARSGEQIWNEPYANTTTENYGATSAPLIVKNEVLVGTSGGDDGVRGFLDAFGARTGKLLWRFWTIPSPGEFGSSSWPGKSYLRGGGTTWMPGTYDPRTNTLYWGTGNPAPDAYGEGRPGDDLYTDCLLALNADTGKLKWYFQFTPHDLYDYDAVETPLLIDSTFKGNPRKLVVEANRNGFIYVLDRTNGKFLSAIPFVREINWASGIDATGRPIRTGLKPTQTGTKICPAVQATNWWSPSYNPSTHLLYIMAEEACSIHFARPQNYAFGQEYAATGGERIPGQRKKEFLLAYDMETNRIAWRHTIIAGRGFSWGGTMTTAGGLTFFADETKSFEAVSAQTGRPLWHFNTGQSISASPMSYAVNGKEYVAIAAGSDVFSFALPG